MLTLIMASAFWMLLRKTQDLIPDFWKNFAVRKFLGNLADLVGVNQKTNVNRLGSLCLQMFWAFGSFGFFYNFFFLLLFYFNLKIRCTIVQNGNCEIQWSHVLLRYRLLQFTIKRKHAVAIKGRKKRGVGKFYCGS